MQYIWARSSYKEGFIAAEMEIQVKLSNANADHSARN